MHLVFATEYTVISSPTLVTQVPSISLTTILWDYPNRAAIKDGTYAQTLLRLQDPNYQSATLTYESFNFTAIPSNATITGIQVTITKRSLGGTAIADNLVQLTLGGENKANFNQNWTEAWDDYTYGGPNDLWGSYFTIAQLQTIGVNFRAGRNTNTGSANQFPQVDGLTLAITYTLPLPIELISFKGRFLSKTETEIQWSTATEINNSHFLLDRSYDGIEFEKVAKINGAGYSQNRIDYEYFDVLNREQDFVYYRIQQVDYNGEEEIYGPITVRRVEFSTFSFFPNPSSDYLIIETTNSNPAMIVEIYDEKGMESIAESYTYESNRREIAIHHLRSGVYFLVIHFKNGTTEKRSFMRV